MSKFSNIKKNVLGIQNDKEIFGSTNEESVEVSMIRSIDSRVINISKTISKMKPIAKNMEECFDLFLELSEDQQIDNSLGEFPGFIQDGEDEGRPVLPVLVVVAMHFAKANTQWYEYLQSRMTIDPSDNSIDSIMMMFLMWDPSDDSKKLLAEFREIIRSRPGTDGGWGWREQCLNTLDTSLETGCITMNGAWPLETVLEYYPAIRKQFNM